MLYLCGFLWSAPLCLAITNTIQFAATNLLVNRSADRVVVIVQRAPGSATNIFTDVSYTTYNGTALSGIDYLAKSGVLTWNNEFCAKAFSIPIFSGGSGNTNKYFFIGISPGPAIGFLCNTGNYTVFVLYNGNNAGVIGNNCYSNMRRDWLPDVLPNGLTFITETTPASIGFASNAIVTISTTSFQSLNILSSQNASSIKTNGFIFSFLLETGTNYNIQTSTNLSSWIGLTNFVCSCATNDFKDLAATNKSKSFYRAVAQ